MAHDWQPDFEQLVDEHQSMVFSLALRMTGDRGLAEEIAQDVFLELDRHLSKIESRGSCPLLAAPRGDEPLGGCVAAARVADGYGWRSKSTTVCNGAITRLRWASVWSRLLATLPEPQRAALILRYQEDLTPEEIAATLRAGDNGEEQSATGIEAAASQGR